eukprot:3602494-Rhodomonas_salina.4
MAGSARCMSSESSSAITEPEPHLSRVQVACCHAHQPCGVHQRDASCNTDTSDVRPGYGVGLESA